MSAGGVFKLIANDGKADRMIMATQLLNQRINDVMCARRKAGAEDDTPTLVDLERTHVLFINAHFKPYAAVGYEYNKVRPESGSPSLGGTVTFSIPQFGDFFHDMVVRQTLSAFRSSLQAAPLQGVAGFPADGFDWDNVGAAQNPADAFNIATYSLVDVFGNPVTPGGAFRNLVRYCEYPGERLAAAVRFDVNGNPLDAYEDATASMLRKFTVGADKIRAYSELVGQGVELRGLGGPRLAPVHDAHNDADDPCTTLDAGWVATTPQMSVAPTSATPAAYLAAEFPDRAWDRALAPPAGLHVVAPTVAPPATGPNLLFDVDPGTGALTGRAGYAGVLQYAVRAVDGPQTPKYEQPPLEVWNKLRFWFNDDVRLAVPSVAIPFGQRFVTVTYAAQAQLAFEFPGLYVRQAHASNFMSTPGAAITSEPQTTTVSYRPWRAPGTLTDIALSGVEMYVNNIFVNPEIHDIFIKRVGFSLIRVYRHHFARVDTAGAGVALLSNLKWPIEYMFVGLRPAFNRSADNANRWRDWHRMCKTVDLVADDYDAAQGYAHTGALIDEGGAVAHHVQDLHSRVGKVVPDVFVKELKTVDALSLTAHGVSLHDDFPAQFFHAYNPFHYGGHDLVSPDDAGALMVNFALHPRSYQPSGHVNVSRAREFYLGWTSRYASAATTADLVAVAIAINFLLLTDGSAVLRYAT